MPDERQTTILDVRTPDGGHLHLTARVTPTGELVVEGCDSGPTVKELLGDYDYEYSWTIAATVVPQVVLALLADSFPTIHPFFRESGALDFSSTSIAKEEVPALLLHLLRQRFQDQTSFGEWIKAKSIPAHFWSWT